MADDNEGGFVPSELHTTRQAAGLVITFAVVVGSATLVPPLFAPSFPAKALAVTGAAAPVVLPMYLSALVAAFVFLLVPGFRRDPGVRESEQVAETRQLVGVFSGLITSLFVVWVGWTVYAAFVPSVHVGGNASVLVSAPLLIPLGVLLTRVARGTLEQQRRDAVRTAKTSRDWYATVWSWSILRRSDSAAAIWPVAVVSGGLLVFSGVNAALLTTVISAGYGVTVGLLMLAIIFGVVAFNAQMYGSPDPVSRIGMRLGVGMMVTLYAAITAFAVWVEVFNAADPLVVVAVLVCSACSILIVLLPWGAKRPLAGIALSRLGRNVERLEAQAARAEQAAALAAVPDRQWWKFKLARAQRRT